VRRVEGLQFFEVIEGFTQGVRAGVFFKNQSWRKLRRDRVFAVVKEKHRRLMP
jgi:hypothetical protein